MNVAPELAEVLARVKREYPLVAAATHRALADQLQHDWPAVETLGTHPDMRIRLSLVSALGLIDDPRASAGIGRSLHDEMAAVRDTAFALLDRRPKPEALPWLKAALLSSDQGIRQDVVARLPRFGADALPLLAAALADSHPDVRVAAVWALVRVDGEAARPLLKSALTDEVFSVRAEARLALDRRP